MARLLITIISVVVNWHRREFLAVRNTLAALTVVPLVLLAAAAFAGSYGWTYKLTLIQLEWLIVVPAVLWLAWRRAAIGGEIGVILSASRTDIKIPFLGDVRVGIEDYIRLAAGILASELALGHVVLWLDLHRNWPMASLLVPTAVLVFFAAVWQDSKGKWWPKVVFGLAGFTMFVALATLLIAQLRAQLAAVMPATAGKMPSIGRLDSAFAALLSGNTSWGNIKPLVVIAALVIAILLIVRWWRKPAAVPGVKAPAKADGGGLKLPKLGTLFKLGLFAFVLWWIFWGGGKSVFGPFLAEMFDQDIEYKIVLNGPGRWTYIGDKLPICRRGAFDVRQAKDVKVKFGDIGIKDVPNNSTPLGWGQLESISGSGLVKFVVKAGWDCGPGSLDKASGQTSQNGRRKR